MVTEVTGKPLNFSTANTQMMKMLQQQGMIKRVKCLSQSKKAAKTTLPPSRELMIVSTAYSSIHSDDLSHLYAPWCLWNNWWLSKYPHNWITINFSNILATTGTIEIGWKLPGSDVSPPLCTGVTWDFFQCRGTSPDWIDLLYRTVKGSTISLVTSFKKRAETGWICYA